MNSAAAWLAPLRAADATIDARVPERASLGPGRARATSLAALGARCVGAPEPVCETFARGLARIGLAQLEAFPGNLFWDFDAFAESLWKVALKGDVSVVDEMVDTSTALMRLFGRESAIRFQYVHDFMYGWDWARWVKRRPEERASAGPYGLAFLRYSYQRGDELLALIAQGDEKYAPLDGPGFRNPFGFQRDPEGERRLLRRLAESSAVPVRAWEASPSVDWRPDYAGARRDAAAELGLRIHPKDART